ncbi:sugar kinase [Levilactobacillus tujiorum]|uniref:sugar kinase n=1 Tax=Levilactobacillus tujiorum TaxID=2912243 RepID=UPI00145788E9|nr:sugar kinase [Levilactobacillus tujiorum]NLR32190.1 sugar kinase [Levilactobacillus tujiorum]
MGELLTIGEPMVVFEAQESDVDLATAQQFQKFSAGAELNVAIGMARLGHPVDYVSAVGDDPFGVYLRRILRTDGVADAAMLTKPGLPTGFYLKQRVSHGDPAVAYFRQGSAASHYQPADLATVNLADVRLAHLSGIFAALSPNCLAAYRQLNADLVYNRIPVTFDPNLRPTLWSSTTEMIRVTNDLARYGTFVMPGLSEGQTLTGLQEPEAIADFYLRQGVTTRAVIVKLGAQGAFAKLKDGRQFTVPGFTVPRVIDTVGAGDGFAVGLISGLLEGQSLPAALKRANAIGALAVQSPGDNDGYPTRQQLDQFFKRNH